MNLINFIFLVGLKFKKKILFGYNSIKKKGQEVANIWTYGTLQELSMDKVSTFFEKLVYYISSEEIFKSLSKKQLDENYFFPSYNYI